MKKTILCWLRFNMTTNKSIIYSALLFLCFLFLTGDINVVHAQEELDATLPEAIRVMLESVFYIKMTVTNNKTVDVHIDNFSDPTNEYISLILEPTPWTIPLDGGKADFIWWCEAKQVGFMNVGFTAESSQEIQNFVSVSTNITVVGNNVLEVTSLKPNHTKISEGQEITITVTVKNIGATDLIKVVPPSPIYSGIYSENRLIDWIPGPLPSPVNISQFDNSSVEWTFSTDTGSAGDIEFSVGTESVTVTIQTPPILVIDEFTISPQQISEGQSLTATMTVTNTGVATAKNVAPECPPPPNVKESPPQSVQIEGGQSRTFTWTYVAQSDSSGNVDFLCSVKGFDANWEEEEKEISSSETKSASLTIQHPPELKITTTMQLPNGDKPVNVGQPIIFYMTVKNVVKDSTLQATGENVTPSIVSKPSGAINNIATTIVPAPVTISLEPGGEQTFMLEYEATSPEKNVTFSGEATGNDSNGGEPVKTPLSPVIPPPPVKVVNIQNPAVLETAIEIDGDIIKGQDFTLKIVVENTGDAAAEGVTPDIVRKTGDGKATFSGPNPSSETIKSRIKKTFTWNGKATKAGEITLYINVQGTDANSEDPLSIDDDYTKEIKPPPATELSIPSIKTDRDDIIEGQDFTLKIVVENTGDAAAENIIPTVEKKSGRGNATFDGPKPPSVTIEGGKKQIFTWDCTAKKAGDLTLSINVEGNLSFDDDIQHTIVIKPRPELKIIDFEVGQPNNPIPDKISEGQEIIVTVTIKNKKGAAEAFDVTPFINVTPTTINEISEPTDDSVDLKEGDDHTFQWIYGYRKGSAGTVEFTLSVEAEDNMGELVTVNDLKRKITIQEPAELDITSMATESTQISEGQNITLTIKVNNTGQVIAKDVQFDAKLVWLHEPGADLKAGTPPTIDIIESGIEKTVSWTWTTVKGINGSGGSAGTLRFEVTASGADFNSGEIIKSRPSTSGEIVIQTPPILKITNVKAEPNQISEGQDITVTVVVENSGQAKAIEVETTLELADPTGNIEKIKVEPDAKKEIDKGKTEIFKWVYATKRFQDKPDCEIDDTITFTATASGKDYNSQEPVEATGNTSNEVVIIHQEEPLPSEALEPEISVDKTTVSAGQTLNITMSVTNISCGSERVAINVKPSLEVTPPGDNDRLSGPTPRELRIEPQKTGTFKWKYETNLEDLVEIGFRGNAEGTIEGEEAGWPQEVESPKVTVQSPAKLEIFRISINQKQLTEEQKITVTEGQKFPVTITVTNTGEATAEKITPSLRLINGWDKIRLVSGPEPITAQIPGRESKEYEWTYEALAKGDIEFTVKALGRDANSDEKTFGFEIVTHPVLEVELVLPEQISNGQEFEVVMTVTNKGGATAIEVIPELSIEDDDKAELISGPEPTTGQIPGDGGSQEYKWTYKAIDKGKITFTGKASGSDENSHEKVEATITSGPIEIFPPPELKVEKLELRVKEFVLQQISEGQNFEVVMTVTNEGEATAIDVIPELTIEGDGKVELVSGPEPTTGQIPGDGESQEYKWMYKAIDKGKITFTGKASESDTNSGKKVESPLVTFGPIEIVAPAALKVEKLVPQQISEGQNFEVVMTVTNEGEATAIDVTPELPIEGDGKVELVSGPEPTTGQIPGDGGSQEYKWTYKAIAEGEIKFTGIASGSDENSHEKVEATITSDSEIVKPAKLKVTEFKLQEQISEGQEFEVVMTVTNEGEATAIDVIPELTIEGDDKVELVSGPEPTTGQIPGKILGGESQEYKWTYKGIDKGNIKFTGIASGNDENSHEKVEATITSDLRVEMLVPKQIGEGQNFEVVMTVTNKGGAIAKEVKPTIELSGTSKLITDVKNGLRFPKYPEPSVIDIPGGESHEFTYVYETQKGDKGNIQFKVYATGIGLQSNEVTADVTIQTPPDLKCTLEAEPKIVNEGQKITFTMTVKNDGEAAAINVLPSELIGIDKANNLIKLPPRFQGSTLESGASAKFNDNPEWRYIPPEGSAGKEGEYKIIFRGHATGKDENLGDTITSKTCQVEVTIQKPSLLTSELKVAPAQISEGQEITVIMTVMNEGKALSKDVTPSVLIISGKASEESGPILKEGDPIPLDILGGSIEEYTWKYTTAEGDAAVITFTGNAEGTDINIDELVSSTETTSPVVTIQTPAKLISETLQASPDPLNEGQTITLEYTVKNIGQATAIDVKPSEPKLTLGNLTNPTPKGPFPEQVELQEGQSQKFRWTYQTQSGDAGTIQFAVDAIGNDENFNDVIARNEVISDQKFSNEVRIQIPAQLEVSVQKIIAEPKITAGQEIRITMTVKNISEATARIVEQPKLDVEGGGQLKPDDQTKLPVDIEGGGEFQFQWTYIAPDGIEEEILVTFTGTATGIDVNSEEQLSGQSQSIIIVVPIPTLVISDFTVNRTQLSEGQDIIVTMKVKNEGSTPVIDVNAGGFVSSSGEERFHLKIKGDGGVTLESTTTQGRTLNPGAEQIYIWRYSSATIGSERKIIFAGHAEGINKISGEPVGKTQEAETPEVTIQPPAHLSCKLRSEGTEFSEGQKIIVTFTVTNDGGASTSQVEPKVSLLGTSALRARKPTQKPEGTPDLAGGESHDFVWVYDTSSGDSGTIQFTATAIGHDGNSGQIVQCEAKSTIQIQQRPNLITTLEAAPAQISEGQQITVTMTVKNEDAIPGKERATALNVEAPKNLEIIDTGRATLVSPDKTQVVGAIFAGESHTFEPFIYQTTSEYPGSAGTIRFKALVTGIDQNSELSITSNEATSNSVIIQRPATLKCEVDVLQPQPDEFGQYQINLDQGITLEIKVTNTDDIVDTNSTQAPAKDISLQIITKGTGEVNLLSKSPEAIKILPAEDTHIFAKKEYKAISEGEVTFVISVSGRDANSSNDISCEMTLTVFIPPSPPDILMKKIDVEKIGAPQEEPIGIEQYFTVKVEIQNRGTVTAKITPSADDLSLVLKDEFRKLVPNQEYNIVPLKEEISLKGDASEILFYELQTNDKTPSGKVIIKPENLDIVDEKTKEHETPTIPSDVMAEKEFDTDRPRLLSVVYKDTNDNGEVEQGEKLFLTFSEPVKLKNVLADDIELRAGDTIGENPDIFLAEGNGDLVIITLGDNPVLHPEGIGKPNDFSLASSYLGIEDSGHIIDFAGNTSPPSILLDIDIEDKDQPILFSKSTNNETVNDMPVFFFRVTDDGPAFDSGIDLSSLELTLDNQTPLEWRMQYPSTPEYLRDGTPITAIVEVTGSHLIITNSSNQTKAGVAYLTSATRNISNQNEILQDFYKDIVLKIVFRWSLNPGLHRLTAIIRDNQGNAIREPLNLIFYVIASPENRPIINLATYPNPFKSGRKTVIRYILAGDIDNIELNIYDVSGRLVRIFKESGKKGLNDNISWDGKTEFGDKVAAGIYICELVARDDKKYWRIAVLP